MTNLTEAIYDRAVTLVETRRKDLVRLAIKDSKYTYLLEEVLISGSSPDLEGLLLAIAADVVDCPWF